jgi:DNA-binding SARP family transcriptional activator
MAVSPRAYRALAAALAEFRAADPGPGHRRRRRQVVAQPALEQAA